MYHSPRRILGLGAVNSMRSGSAAPVMIRPVIKTPATRVISIKSNAIYPTSSARMIDGRMNVVTPVRMPATSVKANNLVLVPEMVKVSSMTSMSSPIMYVPSKAVVPIAMSSSAARTSSPQTGFQKISPMRTAASLTLMTSQMASMSSNAIARIAPATSRSINVPPVLLAANAPSSATLMPTVITPATATARRTTTAQADTPAATFYMPPASTGLPVFSAPPAAVAIGPVQQGGSGGAMPFSTGADAAASPTTGEVAAPAVASGGIGLLLIGVAAFFMFGGKDN